TKFMQGIETDVIGKHYGEGRDNGVDNVKLIAVNKALREHPVEVVGARLRASMTAMKPIV
ncbi:MAG: ketol-acid reductoisomerase, partial [Croceitalea sp.]|nr:ketol-acid reductoisomerase [Croceitalea sp.]